MCWVFIENIWPWRETTHIMHSNLLCAFCVYVANTKASNLAHNRPDTVFGIGIAWLPTTVESPAKFVSGL
jgi:hypothetical protein